MVGKYQALSNVLLEVRRLLLQSKDSVWTYYTVSDMLAFVDEQNASLEDSQTYRKTDLELFFAPTGALQDTAIDNGWGDQFLHLSAKVGQLIRSM